MRGTGQRGMHFITVAVAVIVLGFLFAAYSGETGDRAAGFTLPDLAANKVSFPDDFNGRVVMIRFWTAMCHYCVREMPTIETIYIKYKDRGFTVLAINVGQRKEEVKGFLAGMKITYPVLLDLYSAAAKKYGFESSPTTFITDRKGNVKEKFSGEVKSEVYEKIISELCD